MQKAMINFEALFKISYGLYIVCSGDNKRGNGFISNTVFQVTAEPAKFAACCNKNNLTADFIQRHGVFSVSLLSVNAASEMFARFGYKSGRDINKLEEFIIKYPKSRLCNNARNELSKWFNRLTYVRN